MIRIPNISPVIMAGLISAGLLVACGKKESATTQVVEKPLASVNGVAITEEDFAFEVQRRIESRRPVGDVESIVQDLIQRQMMLQQAESSGVLNDPVARRELENKMLTTWLDQSLKKEKDAVSVTDEELRRAYEENIGEFTKPALVRLAILFRKISPGESDESIAALKSELEKGLAKFNADRAAASQNGRMKGFGSIAADFSEDAISRYRGGDVGWLPLDGSPSRLPSDVFNVGVGLETGEISDLIQAGDGLYVVMKSDQRNPEVTSFEEALPALRRRLISEKQANVEEEFMNRLKAASRVEVDQSKLSALKLPSSTGTEIAGQIPGMIPVSDMKPRTSGN